MIPQFTNKEDMVHWFRGNKNLVITAKKSAIKYADPISFFPFIQGKEGAIKAVADPSLLDLNEFPVKVAINTTNLMDSYSDVHMPGLWNKSLKELKMVYLLQEHQIKFDKIISDRVTASAKMMNWSELDQPYTGQTEVLLFDAIIEKIRNEYMAGQYAKGYVKNHSVGMQYVKLFLALNSEAKYDVKEKDVWDQYIDQVANKDAAEEQGYFFAVTEAKVIEGSAVPLGANWATPTISIGSKSLPEAVDDTSPEPFAGLKFLTNK